MNDTHIQATQAPVVQSGKMSKGLWILVALLTVIPVAAMFHHLVFYRPQCMLNPFGPDYYPEVVANWIRNDPSLPIALLVAVLVWAAGVYRPQIRLWALAFVFAFLPLSIWIWDIPFTGRVICDLMHDGRVPLRTLHLYLLGLVVWFPIVVGLRKVQRQWSIDKR